jgi:hypothetical protein
VALSEDQRAMLQLLLERGQSYEDIAGLLGLSVDEVRGRARAALTEIGGEDPDRDVGLTDYLLGQADPIGRADAARHLQSDPDARELADKLLTQLRLLAPGAELPTLPDAKAPKRAKAAAPATTSTAAAGAAESAGGAGRSALSTRQRRLIAGLIGGGLLVVVVVLIVAGVFSSGGGGESSSASTGGGSGSKAAQKAAATKRLTRAVLEPVGGESGSGAAIFGRVRSGKNDVAVVQLAMSGLKPTAKDEVYVIWLEGPGGKAFPLTRDRVGKSGQLRGLVPVQPQLLQALAAGAFDRVSVTRATQSSVLTELRKSGKGKQLPKLVGTEALTGKIVGPGFKAARAAAQAQGGGSAGTNGG